MPNTMLIQDGIIFFFDGPDYNEVVAEVFKKYESEVLGYMQSNAPWEDQTGAAREELSVTTEDAGDEVMFTLSHGVDYGVWLETIQSGRFAILLPTIEVYEGQMMEDVAEAVATSHQGKNF